MAIKFRSPFTFSKKENVPEINTRVTPTTELFNGQYFYPLKLDNNQNDKALHGMYNDLPEVSAPINYIIDKSTVIPIRHQVKRGDVWEDLQKSKVIGVLESPNQFDSGMSFREMFGLYWLVFGNVYVHTVRPIGFSSINELFLLQSQYTKPKLSKESDFRLRQIIYFESEMQGHKYTFPADQVKHVRQASLTDKSHYIGRSRLMSAILTSRSLKANYEARVSVYESRGAMGILSPKSEGVVLSEEEATQMIKTWHRKFGVTETKSPLQLNSIPMDYTNISPDIKGMMLNENKLQDYQTICSVLKFPAAILNDNSRATYNNINTLIKSFYQNCSVPLNRTFTDAMQDVFGIDGVTERLWADYSEVPELQTDYNSIVNQVSKMWNDGVISEDEYRNAMGYESDEGGERKKSNTSTSQAVEEENGGEETN